MLLEWRTALRQGLTQAGWAFWHACSINTIYDADRAAVVYSAGNNAVEMQTTATWDPRTGTFIIHSPTTLSHKYWITNSAVHAQWCVVFAQLLMGNKNHGIHGFLVR